MKKYIVTYHAPAEALQQTENFTPEQMAEGMKPWMERAERCGDGLLDIGTPLGGGQKISDSGSFPSDKNVVGYSILQAECMEETQDMLKGHPHLGWTGGCEIEVHESLSLPD